MKINKLLISDEFLDSKLNLVSYKFYLIGIILFGILVRGRQYLANRSFWLDEAFLANNLKYRGFSQLLEPLEYSQVAPIGFLWSEKLMANLFGLSELSLRFIPFISSIIAIYLLYDLSRILLGKRLALIIAFAFTLPFALNYYSSELKQYMTDILSALLLFWFFYKYIYFRKNKQKLLYLGVMGAMLLWLSNITPIILLSIGFALWIDLIRRFSFKKLLYVMSSNIMWLASFAVYYSNFIKDHPHREVMQNYWANAFMPHQFLDAIIFVFEKLFFIFKESISYGEVTLLALLFFFAGLTAVFFRRVKPHLLNLLLPIVIHFGLSFFKLYPFDDRLVLYLVPIFLIIEIIGISFIASFFKQRTAALVLLSVSLLILSFSRMPSYFVNPYMREDIKPVLAYISSHKEENDIVYVYSGSHAAFRYYREAYFTNEDICIIGRSSKYNFDEFSREFDLLESRVWVVFSHMNPKNGIKYIDEVIPAFEQLDYFEAEGAKVYLINKI